MYIYMPRTEELNPKLPDLSLECVLASGMQHNSSALAAKCQKCDLQLNYWH